jgi:PEP-CTERM motif
MSIRELQIPNLFCAVAALAFVSSAVAVPTVYSGLDLNAIDPGTMPNSLAARDQFATQLPAFGVESFQSFAAGTEFHIAPSPSLTFVGSSVTAVLTGGLVRDTPFQGRFAVDGTHFLDTAYNQRITFNTPVAAFGLYVVDFNEVDNNPATVTVGGQTLTQTEIEARPFDSVDGIFRIVTERSAGNFELLYSGEPLSFRSGYASFVGLIDAASPYSNIILINGASGLDDVGFLDGFAYDQLMVATPAQLVPEPSTWALLMLGLLGMVVVARRAA